MRIKLKAVWWAVFVFLGLSLAGTSSWVGTWEDLCFPPAVGVLEAEETR